MSSLELAEEFGLRQKTVWEFKWKIQQAMASSRKNQLCGKVQIDEFMIGEYEEGKVGRSGDSKKKLVIVALEILDEKGGVGRAYAQVIERVSFNLKTEIGLYVLSFLSFKTGIVLGAARL